MSFHSLEYLVFLPLALAAFFLAPHRYRWAVIVVASVIFYASWRIDYIVLLIFSMLVDYCAARIMPRVGSHFRKILMAISLICNLGILLFFKFFTDLASSLFASTFRPEDGGLTPMLFLLPLGISFYTFQTLSYTIDVYRGKREPERHLGYFAAYVMFFPQLIAGPIERFGRLMPQLRSAQAFDWARCGSGGALILIGLYKKLVIADGLAPWLARTMERVDQLSSSDLFFVGLGTAYRYYSDLSGYADIAIGSALLFGIKLSQNFNRPFAAQSVTVMWQRWHITVTNWFRDYLYIPLVRQYGGLPFARPLVTTVVMAVVGVWHGATWNWMTIGLLGGVIIGLSNFARKQVATGPYFTPTRKRAFDLFERVMLWIYIPIMGILVLVPEPGKAWMLIGRMTTLPRDVVAADFGPSSFPSLYLIVAIIGIEVFKWFDSRNAVHARLQRAGHAWSFSFYLMLIAVVAVFGTFGNPDFLYFHF